MTTMTQTADRVRTARRRAVCAARNCLQLIQPGSLITKRPGGGWAHADCAQPWQGLRGRRPAAITGGGRHHNDNEKGARL